MKTKYVKIPAMEWLMGGGTDGVDLKAQGMVVRALCIAVTGGLPVDNEKMASMVGCELDDCYDVRCDVDMLLKQGKQSTALQETHSETWEAYASTYYTRYGVEPVRNAMTNRHIKQIVERIGKSDAVKIARFYVLHNNPYYVANRHPTGAMLRDCESLYTQWKTGIVATKGEAANVSAKDETVEQVRRVQKILGAS